MLVNAGVACHAVDVLAVVTQPPRRVASALHAYHHQRGPAATSNETEQKQKTVARVVHVLCSRALPVCQHRPVPYPLDSATDAINQTLPHAACHQCQFFNLRV